MPNAKSRESDEPRTWRNVKRVCRTVVCAALLLLATPAAMAVAHEVPARVAIMAFVKPEGDALHVVVRVPLESMRDMQFPLRADGTLDVARLLPMLPDAAGLWVANYITFYENGAALAGGRVANTQLSVPSDRSFEAYDRALEHVRGGPPSPDVELRWNQAMFDMELLYPIHSAQSNFSVRPALAHLGIRTTTVLRFLPPGRAERVFQYAGNPGTVLLDPRWHQAAWRFVQLGVEHILGGYDHLLFIFCLLIPVRRWRALAAIVTAFTAAHSITLVASAYGFAPGALWFPPLVETLIALSIVYMALENILATPSHMNQRWMLAFGFGLVHGFGFSFALRESLQFAGVHLLTSLAAFNIGVELGQLLVLALALPILAFIIQHTANARATRIVLSALIAHAGWHWMTDRLGVLLQYRMSWPAFDALFLLGLLRALLLLAVATGVGWLLSGVLGRLAAGPPAPSDPVAERQQ